MSAQQHQEMLQRARDDGSISTLYRAAMSGWTYMMTNKRDGVLYTGVAAELGLRAHQHREGEGSSFCRKFGLDRLVWCEHFERIEDAIAREKQLKKWRRAWKIKLIEEMNPDWDDLYLTLNR